MTELYEQIEDKVFNMTVSELQAAYNLSLLFMVYPLAPDSETNHEALNNILQQRKIWH